VLVVQVLVKRGSRAPLLPLSAHIEALRSFPKDLRFITDSEAIAEKINCRDDPSRQYTSWAFDINSLEPADIYPFLWTLLQSMDFPDIFDFSPKTFWNFLAAVEHYMTRHGNPYHNFYHAADVAHACFCFLQVTPKRILGDHPA
jgi:hypothetical protein